jgi:hypothetical protein
VALAVAFGCATGVVVIEGVLAFVAVGGGAQAASVHNSAGAQKSDAAMTLRDARVETIARVVNLGLCSRP